MLVADEITESHHGENTEESTFSQDDGSPFICINIEDDLRQTYISLDTISTKSLMNNKDGNLLFDRKKSKKKEKNGSILSSFIRLWAQMSFFFLF